MKHFILIFFTFIFVIPGKGQNQFHYSQFINNAPIINPAFTGIENNISVVSGFRRQWSAVDFAPTSYYAGFTGTISALKSKFSDGRTLRLSLPRFYNKLQNEVGAFDHGVGFFLAGDHLGPFHQYNAYFNYAFIYNISKQYKVAVGLSSQVNFQRFGDHNVALYSPGLDQVYQRYLGNQQNQLEASLNLGVSLIGKSLFMGYALHQALNYISNDFNTDLDPDLFHYFTGGFNLKWNQQYTFQPAVNIGYANAQNYSINFSGRVKFRQLLWGGLGYRWNESFAVLLGFLLRDGVNVGYSYDFPFNDLGVQTGGNHELTLRLSFYSDKISGNVLW